MMMGMPGHFEILIILGITILLFGGKKIPELARGLGKSLTEFKRGKAEVDKEIKEIKKDLSPRI